MKIPESISNGGTAIAKVIVVGLLILVGYFLVAELAHAEVDYKPLTPTAQKTYESARLTLCNAEKNLAEAKLMDIANGVQLEADLNQLNAKRAVVCEGF